MTEPQDVLAEALHDVLDIALCLEDDLSTHTMRPDYWTKLAASLASRAALVRTPETLDGRGYVEALPPPNPSLIGTNYGPLIAPETLDVERLRAALKHILTREYGNGADGLGYQRNVLALFDEAAEPPETT